MITAFHGFTPQVAGGVFVARSATVLGNVAIGEDASIWYGAVLRGDAGRISIGARTNIQDLTLVHVRAGRFDTTIGNDVTVGHGAILHGCTIDDLVLVGMGALVLDGAHVESECIIGAGAVVTQGTRIPRGSLAYGTPARVVRPLRDDELAMLRSSAAKYVEAGHEHAELPSSDESAAPLALPSELGDEAGVRAGATRNDFLRDMSSGLFRPVQAELAWGGALRTG
jgi:carbonic anhydrase/acetyltransferase-like protein (isoleucine patch superfamily)